MNKLRKMLSGGRLASRHICRDKKGEQEMTIIVAITRLAEQKLTIQHSIASLWLNSLAANDELKNN